MADNGLGLIMSVTVNDETVGRSIENGESEADRSPDSISSDPTAHQPKFGLVPRICATCGALFQITPRQLRNRGGICCSRLCARKRAVRLAILHRPSQAGERNHNFRDWASKRHVVYTRRFKSKNPEKSAAHRAVSYAVASGKLSRPLTCDTCGVICHPDAHHEDYGRPLDVVWVCRGCHVVRDRARRHREHESTQPVSARPQNSV